MKKGLLTLLAASLVFVGCQNYDDQFDDLNAQISALKSQVDGLSSLSGQVSSLSGSIAGLQAGVSAAQAAASAASSAASDASSAVAAIPVTDLSGLEASLATLAAEVDAVQASLATAATATDIATLQAELDAIQSDVDELLATSNVYTKDLTITSAAGLDAAVALGNNINIVNGTVTITQSATMDATKLQSVIDKIFTVTGNYVYTAGTADVTAMTFDNLASTADLTLKVNGPISAKALISAGTITLDDSYTSKVSSIDLSALTTATEIQTDAGGTDNIVFTSATNIDLGSMVSYPGAGSDYGLTITMKKGGTLDISSLDDISATGTAVDIDLDITGAKEVSISNMTSYEGEIDVTNVETLTLDGFKGEITINSGVENINIKDAEQFILSGANDLETVVLDVDKASDPDLSATAKAPAAYGGGITAYVGETPTLDFSSMPDLVSVALTGFYQDLTFTSLSDLTSIDIEATFRDLTVNNNDNLTSFDVTGSSFRNVTTFTSNDALLSIELDHTTNLDFDGSTTVSKSATASVTSNAEATSLTFGADKVISLTVTGNSKLATVNFDGLDGIGTSTSAPYVRVHGNALVASKAQDTDDGTTQYSIDGTNDASDKGTYTTTSGMDTLKDYLTVIALEADADAAVHFDTVSLHVIDTDAKTSSETAGEQNSGNAITFSSAKSNDVTLVFANTASTLDTGLTGYVPETYEQRAWLLDTSVMSNTATLVLQVTPAGGTATDILAAGSSFGTYTMNGNPALDIANLTSSTVTSRATALGTTINAYLGGNSELPAVVFSANSSKVSGSNGEAYTDNEIATYGDADGHIISNVTSYDQFTMTIGGKSVTVTPNVTSGTSFTDQAAANEVAAQLVIAWNYRYASGGGEVPAGQSALSGSATNELVFWDALSTNTASGTIDATSLQSSNSGSRAYGQSIAITHTKPSSATVSYATSGLATFTFMDWTIGATASTDDNSSVSTDIILTLKSTNGLSLTNYATLTVGEDVAPLNAGEASSVSGVVGLTTAKDLTSGTATYMTANDIFQDDAGIYGAISGGLPGDVIKAETANEGVTSTTGSDRVTYTRLHWFGS